MKLITGQIRWRRRWTQSPPPPDLALPRWIRPISISLFTSPSAPPYSNEPRRVCIYRTRTFGLCIVFHLLCIGFSSVLFSDCFVFWFFCRETKSRIWRSSGVVWRCQRKVAVVVVVEPSKKKKKRRQRCEEDRVGRWRRRRRLGLGFRLLGLV